MVRDRMMSFKYLDIHFIETPVIMENTNNMARTMAMIDLIAIVLAVLLYHSYLLFF